MIKVRIISVAILTALFLPLTSKLSPGITRQFGKIVKSISKTEPLTLDTQICYPLQNNLNAILGDQKYNWSITIINDKGIIKADVNGSYPRIPASNQKLVSTAYALDKLGTKFNLKTKLFRRFDGIYELRGEGDPDLSSKTVAFFVNALRANILKHKRFDQNKLLIYEEPTNLWWPSGWHPLDRGEAYGAPITRLALTSNAHQYAVKDPINRLTINIASKFIDSDKQLKIINRQTESFSPFNFGKKLIAIHNSASMISLLSLANAESHNFTAEVLLRHAARTWNIVEANKLLFNWLSEMNIPIDGFNLADASGLSRENKVTSRGLATLLFRMSGHKLSGYYFSSMAISGLRGTLFNLLLDQDTNASFIGKTGTLKGIRSLSGLLKKGNHKLFISILSREQIYPDEVIKAVIRTASEYTTCY